MAKTDEGEAVLQARSIFVVLEQVMRSDYARSQIEQASGMPISTADGVQEARYSGDVYRRPGSREELEAIYDYVAVNGVPQSPTQNVYDPLEVGETLFHDPTGAREDATTIVFGIPGTRQQTNVIRSREELARDIQSLEDHPSITIAGLTGSPYTRQASLDATTDGLQKALVIAVLACLVVTVVAMRSLRYGVDFAIHMTQRYREETSKTDDNLQALHRGAKGTGVALLASAATSILGFAIMAFAPMPMFASYGILTAVMIFLAAAASLLVLPSLLILVTPGRVPEESGVPALAD